MKMSVEWHESCLANQRKTLESLVEEARRAQARVDELRQDSEFYAAQVEAAKKTKRDSFDREKFMKGKK
jgi:hypothetical protein